MCLRAMVAAVALAATAPGAMAADKAEADAVAAARLTMVQAIEVVASEGKGNAVAATFKKDPEPGAYEVKVLRDETLVDYRLDAQTAAIDEQGTEPYQTRYAKLPAATVRDARLSLVMAIEAAEQRVGGKAASAMISPASEKLRYVVQVLKDDGAEEEIKVDGELGLIVKD